MEGYRTHRGVTGPLNFKKQDFFFGKSCSWSFKAPGYHPSTLIDLVNTALASRDSGKTICMIPEGYITQIRVTGLMNFKKRDIFFGKSCSRDFGATDCYQSTLTDLANNAMASKRSVKTICFFSEGYRNQRGVTGPMNFKKKPTFFFRKIVLPGCWGTWLPSKHFN